MLGEDVTNELVEWFNSVDATYRGDLREVNELNFREIRCEAGAAARGAEKRSREMDVRLLGAHCHRGGRSVIPHVVATNGRQSNGIVDGVRRLCYFSKP